MMSSEAKEFISEKLGSIDLAMSEIIWEARIDTDRNKIYIIEIKDSVEKRTIAVKDKDKSITILLYLSKLAQQEVEKKKLSLGINN